MSVTTKQSLEHRLWLFPRSPRCARDDVTYMNIQENIPLAPLTKLQIGGPARYFVEAENVEELKEAVVWAKEKDIPYMVIAGGSNLLVSDEGYNGLIIKIGFSGIAEEGDRVKVKAGTLLQEFVDYTIEQGLDGVSTMSGIPGSVGGAIYGSAGAYGDNIRDHLLSVRYLDGDGIKTLTRDEFETGYRDSIFKHNKKLIILEAEFGEFAKADPRELRAEAEKIIETRSNKYPPNTKCPGSFFKNVFLEDLTETQKDEVNRALQDFGKDITVLEKFGKIPAGALIEILGGKGDQIGQIQIAENHANTFKNLGGGTASDFFQLARKWKNKVAEKFGIELEPEVQLVGFLEPL